MGRARSRRCENEQLNVLKIIVSHRMDEHIEDVTLYRTDVDSTIVKRSVMHHVVDGFIDDGMNNCHIKAEQAMANDSDESRTHKFI